MGVSEMITGAPAPSLRPYIASYTGYRMLGQAPAIHRGLPSRNMTLIFSIGAEIDVVAQTSSKQRPRSYRSVVGGLHDSPALINHDGNQEGVSIQLSPLGSRGLLGLPAAELWRLSLEVDEVVGNHGRELADRLHDTEDWEERFAACDLVLNRLLGAKTVAPELVCAWDVMVSSAGQVTVSDLAAEVGYSRQHLTQRFTQEFGVGPKRAARLIRFERALRMLENTPPFVSTAQVAVACGYYDQAHLHRDFAALAGCTPVELLAGDIPIVQDDPGRPR